MTQSMPDNAMKIMAQALKQSMPNLKTQAQSTAFMISFDSFRLLCDAIFSGDPASEANARELFDKTLGQMRTATELTEKFQEIPEDERGPAANQFVNPPTEFGEYDIQKKLMVDLTVITTTDDLNSWYAETKEEREKVVSQSLRNVLFDAIREKKAVLLKAQR